MNDAVLEMSCYMSFIACLPISPSNVLVIIRNVGPA